MGVTKREITAVGRQYREKKEKKSKTKFTVLPYID